MRESYFHV
jgi:hypothetical protein